MFIKILKWMMLAMVINIALTPWGTSLAIVAGYATIILTVIAVFVNFKGKLQIELNRGSVAIIGLVVIMLLGFVVDFRELRFTLDFIKVVICFFVSYLLINMKPQKHSVKDLVHIFLINKLLAIVYIAYTFVPLSFRYTVVNQWGATTFTMSMGNTNATAVLVMFCVALLCMEFKRETRLGYRIVNAVMVIALVYTLILLQSRTVIACTIVTIASVWVKRIKIKQWYGTVVVLVPIVYFALQIALREMSGITLFGKDLNTGRGEMFVYIVDRIRSTPGQYILGSVTQHKFYNYHNAPISIVANFGFLGLLAYLVFWKHQFRELIENTDRTPLQFIALVVLFAFMIHSSAEATPMLGAIPFSSAIIIITRLAKDQFVEEPVEEQLSRLPS